MSGSLISPCGPRVHACISIHCYFMYLLLKCINYYRKKVSKHTNVWRLTLALYFSSNCTIALSPLLQAIVKAESPFCMKVTTNIAPIFCISRKNGSTIYNVYAWCMCHVRGGWELTITNMLKIAVIKASHIGSAITQDISVKYKWVTCLFPLLMLASIIWLWSYAVGEFFFFFYLAS